MHLANCLRNVFKSIDKKRPNESDILFSLGRYACPKSTHQDFDTAPPTIAVVTGSIPHPRVQLWWRQEVPITDPDQVRQQIAVLARTFCSDLAVVNCSRVMRLPGTIAWPTKPGREVELTTLQMFGDGHIKHYMPGQFARAYPLDECSRVDTPKDEPDFGLRDINPVELLRKTKPGNWHLPMRDFTAHCVSAGYPDWIIIEASRQVLDDPGNPSDVATLIESARKKWDVPNPTEDAVVAELPLVPRSIAGLDPTQIPKRRWLYGRRLMRGNVTLTVAAPGIGKTTLALHEALAVMKSTQSLP